MHEPAVDGRLGGPLPPRRRAGDAARPLEVRQPHDRGALAPLAQGDDPRDGGVRDRRHVVLVQEGARRVERAAAAALSRHREEPPRAAG
jgi:hypothetical protein